MALLVAAPLLLPLSLAPSVGILVAGIRHGRRAAALAPARAQRVDLAAMPLDALRAIQEADDAVAAPDAPVAAAT